MMCPIQWCFTKDQNLSHHAFGNLLEIFAWTTEWIKKISLSYNIGPDSALLAKTLSDSGWFTWHKQERHKVLFKISEYSLLIRPSHLFTCWINIVEHKKVPVTTFVPFFTESLVNLTLWRLGAFGDVSCVFNVLTKSDAFKIHLHCFSMTQGHFRCKNIHENHKKSQLYWPPLNLCTFNIFKEHLSPGTK